MVAAYGRGLGFGTFTRCCLYNTKRCNRDDCALTALLKRCTLHRGWVDVGHLPHACGTAGRHTAVADYCAHLRHWNTRAGSTLLPLVLLPFSPIFCSFPHPTTDARPRICLAWAHVDITASTLLQPARKPQQTCTRVAGDDALVDYRTHGRRRPVLLPFSIFHTYRACNYSSLFSVLHALTTALNNNWRCDMTWF